MNILKKIKERIAAKKTKKISDCLKKAIRKSLRNKFSEEQIDKMLSSR